MRMRPISSRANKPENNDPSIVEPIALATSPAELATVYVMLGDRGQADSLGHMGLG
jgi:hypothetical protein